MLTFSRDRIASLKAAAVGAIALFVTRLAFDITQGTTIAQPDLWIGTALCGGVFGLTYRYVLRQESDIHLSTGAIAAFTIARAAGQWEGPQASNDAIIWSDLLQQLAIGHWQSLVPLATTIGFLAIANGIPFVIAALAIELAFDRGWVARSPSDRRSEPWA